MVVSRREPQLFDHLAQGLKGTAGVEVLLDRRQTQRRKGGAQPDDRRHGERRASADYRVPAIGSHVVRVGGERAAVEPAAGKEAQGYRTLLWPSVRLDEVLPRQRERLP